MGSVFKGTAYYLHGAKNIVPQEIALEGGDGKAVIKITRGGICGSDVHYFMDGRNGNAVVRQPFLMGHETIGVVASAPECSGLKPGQRVALNPSLPCAHCENCLKGIPNHCTDMKFLGSAMRMPHIQGYFASYVEAETARCVPYADSADDKVMCFAEPLSVAIHSVNQAGSLIGKKVLVGGAGPIGCLIAAAARVGGASSVTAFDINANSRKMALAMGADEALDPAADLEQLKNAGGFDVAFDASGAQPAVELALALMRPKGILVQVGNSAAPMPLPMMVILNKEITLRGSFRFAEEFTEAVRWLESGRLNPLPLLSAEIPADNMAEAIAMAADKNRAAKVQLVF